MLTSPHDKSRLACVLCNALGRGGGSRSHVSPQPITTKGRVWTLPTLKQPCPNVASINQPYAGHLIYKCMRVWPPVIPPLLLPRQEIIASRRPGECCGCASCPVSPRDRIEAPRGVLWICVPPCPAHRSHRGGLGSVVDMCSAVPRPQIASRRPGECCGHVFRPAPRTDRMRRSGECCGCPSRLAPPRDCIEAAWGVLWTCIPPCLAQRSQNVLENKAVNADFSRKKHVRQNIGEYNSQSMLISLKKITCATEAVVKFTASLFVI